MVSIYNGILLSHKKEWVWVSFSEVAEPRACYTEWSKSERENKYHILMHICGLKKNATDEHIHSNLTILCIDSFFVVVRVKQENQKLLY